MNGLNDETVTVRGPDRARMQSLFGINVVFAISMINRIILRSWYSRSS